MNTVAQHTAEKKPIYVPFFVPRILQALAWFPTRLLFNIFTSFTVVGLENVTKSSSHPILFVANHSSEFDPIAVRAALPMFWKQAPLFYVTAPLKEFSDTGFSWRRWLYSSSWFFSSWGAYPAKRGTGSYEKALQLHATFIKEKKTCFLIFPEGKRVDPKVRSRSEVHGGAGYLAGVEGITVIPVAIKGFTNSSPFKFLTGKQKTSVTFDTSYVLDEKNTQHTTYKDIATDIMDKIYSMLDNK